MSVWHKNKLRFPSLEWCWWDHRKMTTEKEREGKRTSTQPSYRGTQYSGNSIFLCLHILPLSGYLFSCITQTFKCSQCPEFMYFPSYPKVIISVYIFLSLCFFSHCWIVLLHSEGYALSIGYFLGVLFSQFDLREVSHLLSCSLSLSLSPSSFVQRVCNQLPVLTVDTSKKYDFNFSKKIWIMQCSPHRQYPPLLASCTI